MKYFLDISVVALIVITVVVACRRGFVRSVFGMVKTLAAVIIAYFFGPAASSWIGERLITQRVNGYVYDRLLDLFEAGAESFDLTTVLDRLPDWIQTLLQQTGTDPSQLVGEMGDMTDAGVETMQQFAAKLAAPVADILSDLLGHGMVFLIALLVLSVAGFLLGKLVELPILKQINHALGFLLGIGTAFVYASVYTVLIYVVFNMMQGMWENFSFQEAVENTIIFKELYKTNIIRWLLGLG